MTSLVELVWAFRTARIPEKFEELAEKLYLQIRPVVAPYIFVELRSKADAEDALQNTFATIFGKIDQFRNQTDSSFRGWCFRIAIAEVGNLQRAGAKERKGRGSSAIMWELLLDSTDDDALTEERLKRLRACLERLEAENPDFHKVLYLRYFKKMDYQEIAQKCGVTEQTARKRGSRGREQLRNWIDQRSTR